MSDRPISHSASPIRVGPPPQSGSSLPKGTDVSRSNLQAAKLVADILRGCLGPMGTDKAIIDSLGDLTVSNDGRTILKKMEIEHPAGKIMVYLAETMEKAVGDGVTSAVVMAGSLLGKADSLLSNGIHPTVVADGYLEALDSALEVLESISIRIPPRDRGWLVRLAGTTLNDSLLSDDNHRIAEVVVDAALAVVGPEKEEVREQLDNVGVVPIQGGSILETKLITGVVIDNEIVSREMPRRIERARLALLNCPLEIKETRFAADLKMKSPLEMREFMRREFETLKTMVDRIVVSGARVVLCQQGMADQVQLLLARAGVSAARRAKGADLARLSKATGAKIVTDLEDLSEADLGYAGLVEERRVLEGRRIFVEDCRNPRAVTILVRGGSQRIAEETAVSLHKALKVVGEAMRRPQVVLGGGATEVELAFRLKQRASQVSGKPQLAFEKFCEALEEIPVTLAENAGSDPIDTLLELRTAHAGGRSSHGVADDGSGITDMRSAGIVEPLSVKAHILASATETACMILRIDQLLAAPGTRPPERVGEEPFDSDEGGESREPSEVSRRTQTV